MGRRYKRTVALTLAHPRTYFAQEPNAVIIRDLRVTFSVEKHLGSEPNTSSVTIYDLSESVRAELQRKPLWVRLEAGYDGAVERVFVGDMTWARSRHDGVDWLTELTIGDGHRAYAGARVNRSYKSGINVKTALSEVAKSMGLTVPSNVAGAAAFLKQFSSGLSLQGPSQKELTKLLKPHGYGWSVQDGELQVLRESDVRVDQALLVSQTTGMLGSPDYGAPKQPGEAPILTVKTLLQPSLAPGARIQVESKSVRGTFRVERVVHAGDTQDAGSEWSSEIEAKPL